MGVTCECSGKPNGYTNLGLDFGTQWWVHAECGKPTKPWLEAQGGDMLNFFRGGPLDGSAYSTSTLLDGSQGETGFTTMLSEYKWTPEVVVSQKTGASARVWVHKSLPVQEPVKQQADAGPTGAAPSQEGIVDMAKKEQSLEDRRKAGKFSRNQVAQAAGLTVSKVYGIEKDGARVTDDERAQYAEGLDKLEAEANA